MLKIDMFWDHYALVLKMLMIDWRLKPFRSLNAYTVIGFNNIVKRMWDKYTRKKNGMITLKEKIKKIEMLP